MCTPSNRGSHSMSSGILYLYNCAFKPKNMYQFSYVYLYIYIASHLLALFPKIGSMKKCSVFFSDFFKDNAASTRCELHIVKQLATASAPYKYKTPRRPQFHGGRR